MNKKMLVMECLLWLCGFILILLQNWEIGLGVFLVLWANNLEWRRKIKETNDNSQYDRKRL